jgi:hypothetical protein
MTEATGSSDQRDFDPAAYGRAAAQHYDALHAGLDPARAVRTLAELADGQPVVEFGIGRDGSRCRWPSAAWRCMASTDPQRWPPGCGASRAATRYR